MLHSKYLLFSILLTFVTGELCQEPGLALVADGAADDHLMLTEATEVMLLGEGECDVMVSYLAVGGGGSYYGAGGGSGGVTFGQVSWPAGGSVRGLLQILQDSSTIFTFPSVCPCVTIVTSHLFTFITCPRPHKPYIF